MSIPGFSGVKHRIGRKLVFFKRIPFRPLGIAQRCFVLLPVFVFPLFLEASAYQQPEKDTENPPTELTDEEKEIIKDRDILENLALLQDLDKVEFIDILNALDPDWSESEESDEPAEKKEGTKP